MTRRLTVNEIQPISGRFQLENNETENMADRWIGGEGQTDIDTRHKRVHRGEFITANYLELLVANNATIYLRVITGARPYHFTITLESEGKAAFKTYSGTTYTVEGTLPDGAKLTAFNRAGGSLYAPTTTFRFNPTVNAIGTLRGNRQIYGGTGGNAVGTSAGGGDVESTIPQNSSVLITLTNISGQAKDMGIVVDGYEVS